MKYSLLEYYGITSRLDTTGVRGGLNRPLKVRDNDFPYDSQQTYGTPQAYDRTSNYGRDQGKQQIIPKDLEHTHWDGDEPTEEVDEAITTPVDLRKSNNGEEGGRTIPGTSGPWANSPFDTQVSDEELTKAAKQEGQYQMGTTTKRNDSRWHVVEAFVSLIDVPEVPLGDTSSVRDAELEVLLGDFLQLSNDYRRHLDQLEVEDLIHSLLDLDREYVVSDISRDLDKERLMNTYNSWEGQEVPSDKELEDEIDA